MIAGEFQPKYAAIVKDKDELRVPLSLATLPTPKVCGYYMRLLCDDDAITRR